jgi:hypothetical protein
VVGIDALEDLLADFLVLAKRAGEEFLLAQKPVFVGIELLHHRCR